jgi:hypothetical protein
MVAFINEGFKMPQRAGGNTLLRGAPFLRRKNGALAPEIPT